MGDGAVSGIALHAGGHVSRAGGGGGAIAGGVAGWLGGKDGWDAELAGLFFGAGCLGESVVVAEGFTSGLEEGVVVGEGEVGDGDAGGVGFSSGGSTGDDGDVFLAAGGEEMAFVAGGVDGIDDELRGVGEEFGGGGFGVELLVGGDFYLGIDELAPLGESDGFGLADGVFEGVDLAIGVGEAKVIEVDKGELSDA